MYLLHPSLIALMIEAASASEMLVNFYQTTRRNNPEDNHLHTRRRENLKSCINLVHDRNQWRALVNMAMNLQGPIKDGKFVDCYLLEKELFTVNKGYGPGKDSANKY
jgi:hypothetical protein